jgi:hypothetical protein
MMQNRDINGYRHSVWVRARENGISLPMIESALETSVDKIDLKNRTVYWKHNDDDIDPWGDTPFPYADSKGNGGLLYQLATSIRAREYALVAWPPLAYMTTEPSPLEVRWTKWIATGW